MFSVIGFLNLIWGEAFGKYRLERSNFFIMISLLIFNFYAIFHSLQAGTLSENIFLYILGFCALLTQIIYSQDRYLTCHKELLLLYLVASSSDFNLAALFLASYLLLSNKSRYLNITANIMVVLSIISSLFWINQQLVSILFIILLFLILLPLLLEKQSTPSQSMITMTVSYLLVIQSQLFPEKIILGLVGMSLFMIGINKKNRYQLDNLSKVFYFSSVAYFGLSTLPVVLGFGFLCLNPRQAFAFKINALKHYNVDSRILFVLAIGLVLYGYLLREQAVEETLLLLFAYSYGSYRLLGRERKPVAYVDDLIIGILFILVVVGSFFYV